MVLEKIIIHILPVNIHAILGIILFVLYRLIHDGTKSTASYPLCKDYLVPEESAVLMGIFPDMP